VFRKKFNAKQVIEKYGKCNVFNNGYKKLGKKNSDAATGIHVSQVHLSCKNMYEAQDGESNRMDRNLFGNLLQIENQCLNKRGQPQSLDESSILDLTNPLDQTANSVTPTAHGIQKMPYYACEAKI